jgi:hypothetical protein
MFQMFHVERWRQMFHVEQRGDLLKRLKLKLLHYLTKIIWWFRKKVVSLQRD